MANEHSRYGSLGSYLFADREFAVRLVRPDGDGEVDGRGVQSGQKPKIWTQVQWNWDELMELNELDRTGEEKRGRTTVKIRNMQCTESRKDKITLSRLC